MARSREGDGRIECNCGRGCTLHRTKDDEFDDEGGFLFPAAEASEPLIIPYPPLLDLLIPTPDILNPYIGTVICVHMPTR